MQVVSETPAPVRVLVADDNVDAADVLHDLFEALGCRVEVAYDGKQAIEAARKFEPQLVVLDLNMPVMEGCEAVNDLRRQPGSARAIFVGCSAAAGGPALLDRTTTDGFHHFVVKPARFEWFEGIVDVIRRRRPNQV